MFTFSKSEIVSGYAMLVVTTVFFDLFNTLLSVGKVSEAVGRYTADILCLDRDDWNAACSGSRNNQFACV